MASDYINKKIFFRNLAILIVTLWATILSYFEYDRMPTFLENCGVNELLDQSL